MNFRVTFSKEKADQTNLTICSNYQFKEKDLHFQVYLRRRQFYFFIVTTIDHL